MNWYNKVVNDIGEIPNVIDYYNQEIDKGKIEARLVGSLEKAAQDLSGIMSYRFGQLQDIEAILKWLNIKYDKLRSTHYRKYLEHYNRDLSDRSIEKYIDGEDDIVNMSCIINEVALVRNQYLAIIKGLEAKSFNISNIVKLRTAGLEEVTLR